jgi:hypothetical protein
MLEHTLLLWVLLYFIMPWEDTSLRTNSLLRVPAAAHAAAAAAAVFGTPSPSFTGVVGAASLYHAAAV